jgi:hypothetical protein
MRVYVCADLYLTGALSPQVNEQKNRAAVSALIVVVAFARTAALARTVVFARTAAFPRTVAFADCRLFLSSLL